MKYYWEKKHAPVAVNIHVYDGTALKTNDYHRSIKIVYYVNKCTIIFVILSCPLFDYRNEIVF